MERFWKTVVVSGIFLLVFSLFPQLSKAQLGEPDNPDADPDAPIDGGVSLLIAAGIGYGIKKYRDAGNKKSVDL